MGRKQQKGVEGNVQCKVCELMFEVKNNKFTHIFKNYINNDLDNAINELEGDDYMLIQKEPFFEHLKDSGDFICPGSKCEICDKKTNPSYKPFTSRSKKHYHIKKYHNTELEDKLVGKTGYNDIMRKEVLGQLNLYLNSMKEDQKDFNITYPKIDLVITNWKGSRKADIIKEMLIDKQHEKEENDLIKNKEKKKKEHLKIQNDLEKLCIENDFNLDNF